MSNIDLFICQVYQGLLLCVTSVTNKIFKQTLDDLSPQLNLPLKETLEEIEKLAVSPVNKFHAKRIGVRWRGRPQNSKTRKVPGEARRKTADNKNKVLDAINKLYGERRNKDLKPETKKAIAEAI
jgi:hypothetical protein